MDLTLDDVIDFAARVDDDGAGFRVRGIVDGIMVEARLDRRLRPLEGVMRAVDRRTGEYAGPRARGADFLPAATDLLVDGLLSRGVLDDARTSGPRDWVSMSGPGRSRDRWKVLRAVREGLAGIPGVETSSERMAIAARVAHPRGEGADASYASVVSVVLGDPMTVSLPEYRRSEADGAFRGATSVPDGLRAATESVRERVFETLARQFGEEVVEMETSSAQAPFPGR